MVLVDTTSVAESGLRGRVSRNRMPSGLRIRGISPMLQHSTRGGCSIDDIQYSSTPTPVTKRRHTLR